MEIKLIDIFTQKEVSKKKIASLFEIKEIRLDIIRSVILWQQNRARSGNHKTKTISEISGTTAKPFKQKGTGNARQGSKRAAQHRGGSTIFGPVVRSHDTKLPKKVRRLGLINSIAYHVKNGSIELISEPKIAKPSTKKVVEALKDLTKKNLFICTSETDENFLNSVVNVKNANILNSDGANVYDIMNNDKIYITESAMDKIEKRLTDAK